MSTEAGPEFGEVWVRAVPGVPAHCPGCGHWHDSRPCLGVERSAGGGIQRCGCRRLEQREENKGEH